MNTPSAKEPDLVAKAIQEVTAELAEKRASGELPEFPEGELSNHFTGVIEATEAGIVQQPPLDLSILNDVAQLETYITPAKSGGPMARVRNKITHRLSLFVGHAVHNQVGPFSRLTAGLLHQISAREQKTNTFLVKAHLDRVRSLEYRIAQLERELDQLRQKQS